MAGQNDRPKDGRQSLTQIGLYSVQGKTGGVTGFEIAAVILSALWLIGATVFLVVIPSDPEAGFDGMRLFITLMTIFMPVAMIWVAATAARASRVMREESQRLQGAIDAIRQAYLSQSQARGTITAEPSVARKLEEIAETAKKTETALATFSSTRRIARPPAPAPAEPSAQASLELGTRAEDMAPPLATPDFVRALNFPETAEDEEGFAALRRALKDRTTAQLIQASQDVLTLLSQDGIYMDDLRPDRARPEIWRNFASGARGREVAALGGIRDRSSLALTAGRMKQDPIFRDTAHHFLRRFDRMLIEFEKTATDEELAAMSETRTARAFMLLGRVAGTFD